MACSTSETDPFLYTRSTSLVRPVQGRTQAAPCKSPSYPRNPPTSCCLCKEWHTGNMFALRDRPFASTRSPTQCLGQHTGRQSGSSATYFQTHQPSCLCRITQTILSIYPRLSSTAFRKVRQMSTIYAQSHSTKEKCISC